MSITDEIIKKVCGFESKFKEWTLESQTTEYWLQKFIDIHY